MHAQGDAAEKARPLKLEKLFNQAGTGGTPRKVVENFEGWLLLVQTAAPTEIEHPRNHRVAIVRLREQIALEQSADHHRAFVASQ